MMYLLLSPLGYDQSGKEKKNNEEMSSILNVVLCTFFDRPCS